MTDTQRARTKPGEKPDERDVTFTIIFTSVHRGDSFAAPDEPDSDAESIIQWYPEEFPFLPSGIHDLIDPGAAFILKVERGANRADLRATFDGERWVIEP